MADVVCVDWIEGVGIVLLGTGGCACCEGTWGAWTDWVGVDTWGVWTVGFGAVWFMFGTDVFCWGTVGFGAVLFVCGTGVWCAGGWRGGVDWYVVGFVSGVLTLAWWGSIIGRVVRGWFESNVGMVVFLSTSFWRERRSSIESWMMTKALAMPPMVDSSSSRRSSVLVWWAVGSGLLRGSAAGSSVTVVMLLCVWRWGKVDFSEILSRRY